MRVPCGQYKVKDDTPYRKRQSFDTLVRIKYWIKGKALHCDSKRVKRINVRKRE